MDDDRERTEEGNKFRLQSPVSGGLSWGESQACPGVWDRRRDGGSASGQALNKRTNLVLTRLHDGHPHLSPGMKKVRFL